MPTLSPSVPYAGPTQHSLEGGDFPPGTPGDFDKVAANQETFHSVCV